MYTSGREQQTKGSPKMTKEKRYVCLLDTGNDTTSFDFFSEHRANSKANKLDARNQYHGKYVPEETFIKNAWTGLTTN
jgi:hypothetical protein